MITAFTVKNYRSFLEETRVELRPLTLLFGYNNTGKSSLLRVLPLLADSMRSDVTAPLNLKSDAVRGAVFTDLVSKLGASKTIRFGLEMVSGLSVGYEITRPAGSPWMQLTSVELADKTMETARLEIAPETLPNAPGRRYRRYWNGELLPYDLYNPFSGLTPVIPALLSGTSMEPDRAVWRNGGHRMLSDLDAQLPIFRQHILWIGSLRRYPERFVRFREGGPPVSLGFDGSGIADILAQDKLSGGKLLEDISAWYGREDCFKRSMSVVQSQDDLFSVMLEAGGTKSSLQVNVVDTGEGIAQVLPVLAAVAGAEIGIPGGVRPRLLIFEQPELHLHTAIHAPLAERLCRLAATNDPPRMLIETHSENFLLGVQIEVAKGHLSPERVRIYWVEQDEAGASRFFPIDLDSKGYARGFPHRVFDKDVELSKMLRRAREQSAT